MFESVNAWFQDAGAGFASVFGIIWRFLAPFLVLWILWRCAKPLIRFRREPEVWGWLVMPDGSQLPVTHWENIIGRSKGSDIVVNFSTVSRSHAVLTHYGDGSWTITDIGSRGNVTVNGKKVGVKVLHYGDVISLGGVEMILAPVTAEELREQRHNRTRPASIVRPGLTLLLLTLFQLFTGLQFWMNLKTEAVTPVLTGFLILMAMEWALLLIVTLMRRRSFDVETLAFFLTTLGLSVIASCAPGEMMKQIFCIGGGLLIYLVIGWSLRELPRANKFRYAAAVGGILLLLVNLLIGEEINGAKNWISVGSMSFQPSELVKLCFIYVGASTMERIVSKRNVILFIVYTGFICLCLAVMNDFGTALIFFVTLLVICLLRGGNFATLALVGTVVGFGVLLLLFMDLPPHVLSRFKTWGHAWDDPINGGYQQVRAMMCIASGGLFGLGGGNGWLKYVAASDTDLVFALVCEESGLLIGIAAVLAIVCLGVFVVRSSAVGRSSFYTIASCSAAAVLLTQTILNVFGTMDLLPLTGVTFPFVSNGGSSMLCVWGLLAFIRSGDTRQDASFVVKAVRAKEVELDE